MRKTSVQKSFSALIFTLVLKKTISTLKINFCTIANYLLSQLDVIKQRMSDRGSIRISNKKKKKHLLKK